MYFSFGNQLIRKRDRSNKILSTYFIGAVAVCTGYRTRAIITNDLYTFYSPFEGQKRFFRKFCLYVWLVFKGGVQSRAGYDGAHTVHIR